MIKKKMKVIKNLDPYDMRLKLKKQFFLCWSLNSSTSLTSQLAFFPAKMMIKK